MLNGRTPAVEDVPKLEYARAVVAESMRLYPPAWTMGRRAIEGHTIGGHTIDPGSLVILSQWIVHHDPRWWDVPNDFRPERWLSPAPRPKYAFSHSAAARASASANRSRGRKRLLLATIAQRWTFAPRACRNWNPASRSDRKVYIPRWCADSSPHQVLRS